MKPTLIVIGGPTASGKTSLAIAVAQTLGAEILSADSRQCYRELNIGVARPNTMELATVPHHFIASHSISTNLSAGWYETYGMSVLADLFKRHHTVVAVGGTGLYLQALMTGLDPMPNVPVQWEKKAEQLFALQGLTALQEEVKQLDPLSYGKMDIQNPRRLIRALAFVRATGQSISSFRQQTPAPRPFRVVAFALEPEREILYRNIHARVGRMMDEGLLNEVEGLLPFRHLRTLDTVGYRELFGYLNGQCDLETAINNIRINTRHYAKRQITWFRHHGPYRILPPEKALQCILASR